MTKKLPLEIKQSRKPTRVACSFCHSKHLQCDSLRPCKNCTKRGLSDTCADAVRKKKGVKKVEGSKASSIKSKISGSISKIENDSTVDYAAEETISIPQEEKSKNTEDIDQYNSLAAKGDINGDLSQPFAQVPDARNPEIITTDGSKIDDVEMVSSRPKKRGRPSKNKATDALSSTKKKKLQKSSPAENKTTSTDTHSNKNDVVRNDFDQDRNAVYHNDDDEMIKSNDKTGSAMAGLGISNSGSTGILPRPLTHGSHMALLNLANASLSNINLQHLSSINSSSDLLQQHNTKNDHSSLSDLRLPSFLDLKTPLFSGSHDSRTMQFDLKLPSHPFSPTPDLKDYKELKSTGLVQNFAIMGSLQNISSIGNQNILNSKSIEDDNVLNETGLDHYENQPHKLQTTRSKSPLIGTAVNKLSNGVVDSIIENTDKTIESNKNTNTVDNYHDSMKEAVDPNDPETPGSALEFSVSSATRTNTNDNNIRSVDHISSLQMPSDKGTNSKLDSRFASQDILSSNSSIRNFESTMANDEYIKLTDLLNNNNDGSRSNKNYINGSILRGMENDMKKRINRNVTSPSIETGSEFIQGLSPVDVDYGTVHNNTNINHNDDNDDDDDDDFRPYIIINFESNTMISSYPNNSTPNSFLYNPDHSQIVNTAKQIPKDFEQDEDYTSPLIMRHVIKQPDDIYLTNMVKAYQYPKAYHALIAYLKERFNKRQLLEIAKCMAKYRPSFISATKSLFENDLIFTERSFQRTLLEYENLISMSPSPTIIWRRTGEIVALTNDFAVMTGYSRMSLLSKRTFIVELMDDESTINYFRSFSEFAFGDLNATYLTDCNLRKAEDNNYLRCCCVWTIKRDVFDIPMLIVGQFLPVLE